MKSLTLSLAGLVVLSSTAYAGPCDPAQRTIEGNQAKALITTMKAAGFKAPITRSGSQSVFHYRLGHLDCTYTNGGVFEDGITIASCNALPAGIRNEPATAMLVANALENLGIFGDSGMSHTAYEASDVGCSVTADESGVKYACVATAVWADTCQP